MYLETTANMESSNQQIEFEKMLRHNADEYIFSEPFCLHVLKVPALEETRHVFLHIVCFLCASSTTAEIEHQQE